MEQRSSCSLSSCSFTSPVRPLCLGAQPPTSNTLNQGTSKAGHGVYKPAGLSFALGSGGKTVKACKSLQMEFDEVKHFRDIPHPHLSPPPKRIIWENRFYKLAIANYLKRNSQEWKHHSPWHSRSCGPELQSCNTGTSYCFQRARNDLTRVMASLTLTHSLAFTENWLPQGKRQVTHETSTVLPAEAVKAHRLITGWVRSVEMKNTGVRWKRLLSGDCADGRRKQDAGRER